MVSRFNSIEINGLFGQRKPIKIDFDDLQDPVKILYGVNGSGKTTVMKIIQHSYCWNPIELFKLPFESITYSLNKRGKYNEKTTLKQNRLKCEVCGSASFEPEWSKSFEISMPDTWSKNAKDFICSDCGAVVENPIINSANKSDDLLRESVDEINNLIDEYETEIRKTVESDIEDNEALSGNENKKNNLEQQASRIEKSQAKMYRKSLLPKVEKLLNTIPIILIRKYFELKAETIGEFPEWDPDYDYQDYEMGLKNWQDGLRLGVKGQNLEMRMSSDFEFNTKLTVTKRTNVPEQIYFGFDSGWETIDVGNYIDIQEESEPVFEFEDKLVEDLLEMLQKITHMRGQILKAEILDWGFASLFDTRVKKLSVRMPDVHDYWDSDWDKIERNSKQYRIERFGDNPNQRISVEDWVEIYSKSTNEKIPIKEFLDYHLDNQLVTHSKKGTRLYKDSDSEVKEFSHNMRTPDLISDLFDYQKVAITPRGFARERLRNKYYVELPRILNISTERKNDDDYFYEFSIFFNRIINSCKKLLIPMLSRMQSGSTLQPSFSEETGINRFNSDLIGILSSYKKISLEDFIENILDEIPDAQANHGVPINALIYHFDNDFMDYTSGNISTSDMADVIVSIVKFCEVIKLKRFLKEAFADVTFDIENSKIFADKDREYPIKFSDLSSGIRQKFRIFTSVAMQVISADNSLILIDEPEISLHLSWQRTFVDDLVEFLENLTSKSRIKVDSEDTLENIISIIISTHSPAVLANHFHRGQKIGESDLSDE